MEPVTLVITGQSLRQSPLLYALSGSSNSSSSNSSNRGWRWSNGKWRPTPKSAPPNLSRRRPTTAGTGIFSNNTNNTNNINTLLLPARHHPTTRAQSTRSTTRRNRRVTSAHPAAMMQAPTSTFPTPFSSSSSSSSQPPLRVHDVYTMAESTRARMSQECRQLVLTRTQKLVRNDSGMSRPVSGLCPAVSPPSHAVVAARHITLEQEQKEKEDEELEEKNPERAVATQEDNEKVPSNDDDNDHLHHHHHQFLNARRVVSAHNNNVRYSHASSSANASASASAPGSRSQHQHSRLGSSVTLVSGRTSAVGSEMCVGCVSTPRTVDSEARKMSVSRQCCEVMGPGVCRDCQKLRARMKDRERMEADFPRLRISEKNVTTSAVLMRVLPDMTQAEIQDKIARGEIDRGGLQFPPHRFRRGSGGGGGGGGGESDDDGEDESDYNFKLRYNGLPGGQDDDDDDNDDEVGSRRTYSRTSIRPQNRALSDHRPDTAKSSNTMVVLTKLKLKLGGQASTPLFFMDLRHMNSKIYHGRVERKVKTPRDQEEEEGEEVEVVVEEGEGEPMGRRRRKKVHNLLSVDDMPGSVQAFVSPRKMKSVEEPSYKVYFEPPLLAKHLQESTPSFFAGSNNPYHLPDRLPDVIEFADGQTSMTDPTPFRSESSMSFVSAASDHDGGSGTAEGVTSHKGQGEGLQVLQETVQE
ncbi:uncharacterized protein LOC143283503 [Babylonia areolata]|uniref:uncharacterized protein LOC143283503 n=1 Tax=Babylonia areolata TaxID=304850 RepID=UPI003FD4E46D